MAFLSPEEVVEAAPRGSLMRYNNPNYSGTYYRVCNPMTLEQARTLIEDARKVTLRYSMQKINRPWELINLSAKLDKEQAWIGFEFETGFRNREHYERVVNYVFDNCDHTVIDREGTGSYAAEITFPPINYNDYVDGTSGIQKFFNWMHEQGISMLESHEMVCGEQTANMVGTHMNISTPAYRSTDYGALVAGRISGSIFAMGLKSCIEVFNRKPYRTCFPRAGGGSQWIEFKVFKSSTDVDTMNKYIRVAQNMAKLIEYICVNKLWDSTLKTNHIIWNLKDILLGNTEPENMEVKDANVIGRKDYSGAISWAYEDWDIVRAGDNLKQAA